MQNTFKDCFNELPNDILLVVLKPFQTNEESYFVSLVSKKWNSLIKRNPVPIKRVIGRYAEHGTFAALQHIRKIVNNDTIFFQQSLFEHNLQHYQDWIFNELLSKKDPEILNRASCGFAQGGHLIQLQSLYDLNLIPSTSLFYDYAAIGGHQHVLQWSREHKFKWSPTTIALAAQNGHLELLKWLRINGCEWDSWACAFAAEGGHLDILKWLRLNGCEWDSYTCSYAAKEGHLEILQWARANGCDWSPNILSFASRGGNMDIVKWAHGNGVASSSAASEAIIGGHMEIFEWLINNGIAFDSYTVNTAAKYGRIKALELMKERGQSWQSWSNSCVYAAEGGHLDTVKWFLDNGCEWDDNIANNAAQRGHLHILQWLLESGRPLKNVCFCAAQGGHLHILEWAKVNGFKWDAACCAIAAKNGHLDVVKWLRENECEWNANVCKYAAYEGHLEIVQWAVENGCPFDLKQGLEYFTAGIVTDAQQRVIEWLTCKINEKV